MAAYNRSPLENLQHNQDARRKTGRAARRQEARATGRPMPPPHLSPGWGLTCDWSAEANRTVNFGGFIDPGSIARAVSGVRAYVDGVEVSLDQAHNLPRDGRPHYVSFQRTGNSPTTAEQWVNRDAPGADDQVRALLHFGAEMDFRSVERRIQTMMTEDLAAAMQQVGRSFGLGASALQRYVDDVREVWVNNQQVYGIPPSWLAQEFASIGNVEKFTITPVPPEPHPDAGKVVRRPRRSVGGIMVEDYITDDGRVARRPRTDTPK